MASSYTEPTWAQTPACCWHLIEIKSGIEVAKHALHQRRCTLLGRALDVVHIGISHESASRQHARIAFDSQGIPWLRDLHSAHGTTCNKRKLPPQAIGKQESNSHQAGARGVMLFPGDVLQFGASTRIFAVEGPTQFERGAIQAKLQQQQATQPQQTVIPISSSQPQSKPPRDDGVSWGIDMDDETVENNQAASNDGTENHNSNSKTLPMELQVPEKHRKALERLNALKYKLSNLETEDGRIRRKGELTDGQEKQLLRNAEREEILKTSIADQEEDLYDKLYPDKASSKNGRKTGRAHKELMSEDEDDFFDRTKQQDDSGIDNEESEQTLVAKWKKWHHQERHCQDRTLPQAQSRFNSISSKLAKLEADGDEEAFFREKRFAAGQRGLGEGIGGTNKGSRDLDRN